MAFQHLSVYKLWKDRAPTGGPKPEAYLTPSDIKLKDEGFPEAVSAAFLDTADTLKSVILTRVPGKAATGLIDDGYCLKSFYIHAKSCNWGPMAGFVALFPALNKKGVANIDFNLKAHLETKEKFDKLNDKDTSSPFVPLGLSDAAFKRLDSVGDLDARYLAKGDDNSWAIGIAFDKDKTVLMEFLLLPDTSGGPANRFWFAYHRNIYIKRPGSVIYEVYLKEGDPSNPGRLIFTNEQERKLEIPNRTDWLRNVSMMPPHADKQKQALLDDRFKSLWTNLGLSHPAPSLNNFYPILVAQNPYRTYDDCDPRNAITGDYDLFAVWPVGLISRWEETIRLAEGRAPAPPAELFGGALFTPVLGKNMSLQLVYAPNVYVEVIPSFKQIEGLEDPVLGNINDAVHLAGGILNSNVSGRYTSRVKKPNVAFHSDEGGRPEVFEIEFPVAAFLPKGVKLYKYPPSRDIPTTQNPCGLVINNAAEFMDLVELLEFQAIIPLAYGWLMHLLILADQNGTLDALCNPDAPGDVKMNEARKKYLDARKKEREKLGEYQVTLLRARLWSLLTGYDDNELLNRKDAAQAMAQATKVFANLLFAVEDVYKMMCKIRDVTMPPP